MAVPYTFGSATTSIPLSQLDSNFATTITLGNTAIQLGNTVTTLNNMTLGNVTISSGTSNIQTNVANATGVLLEANGGTGTTTGYYGFKNRIINGAMVIDQRNAGASVTNVSGAVYTLDRWALQGNQASKLTIQQSSTAPAGFSSSLKITTSSAYSVGATDYFILSQAIEGYNIADLNWGTANAKTVTLSFQVYSSLTGTFGGVLQNGSSNRTYPFSYTVSSANTWTPISITIAGDTTGTWATNNSAGIYVYFGLGVGSTYSTTAGTWAAGNYLSSTGATSVVGTNGATFYITGVQLEKGSTATSFDYRPYGTELQLCQRYCVVFTGMGGGARFGSGYYNSSTTAFNTVVPIGVPLRTSPTVTASNLTLGIQGAAPTINSISGISYYDNIPSVNFISNTTTGTDGAFGQIRMNATTSSLIISAEL